MSYSEKVSRSAFQRKRAALSRKPGQKDWQEVALQRAEKHKELEAKEGRDPRQCSALTNGIWGPVRPCPNFRMKGLTTCRKHSKKHVIADANQAFLEELGASIQSLREVREQNDHMPSKLGASLKFIERAMGKQEAKTNDDAGKPRIIVGIAIGGIPAQQKTLSAAIAIKDDIVSPDDDIEGEVLTPDGTPDYLNESDDE